MEEFQNISNSIFSNNTLGLVVAIIIFIITISLLARKIIGFFITLLLLFFAVVSGLAIANNDIVRKWMLERKEQSNNQAQREPTQHPTNAPSEDWETRLSHLKDQILQKIEELKEELTKKHSETNK